MTSALQPACQIARSHKRLKPRVKPDLTLFDTATGRSIMGFSRPAIGKRGWLQ
jgi:hypothetical protein